MEPFYSQEERYKVEMCSFSFSNDFSFLSEFWSCYMGILIQDMENIHSLIFLSACYRYWGSGDESGDAPPVLFLYQLIQLYFCFLGY